MRTPDVYDNTKRFIFSNWTAEDFTAVWAGEVTTVKAGETKELPMYLAYNFTKHLVDREMNRDNKSNLMGIDEERAAYENKTMVEIGEGTDSPALASLKAKIAEEIKEETTKKAKKGKKEEEKVEDKGEFADLK